MENNKTSEPESRIAEEPAIDERAAKDMKPKKSFWKELREWIISFALALVIVLICQNFLFTLIRVDGSSMSPTLVDGERLFVTVADVKFGDVARDSVVICRYPNRGRTFFVKRAVGIPGDTVYRENGVTHVLFETVGENGETVTVDNVLDERYGLFASGGSDDYEPYVLGEDEYFVVGDNRYGSHDSRDWKDDDPSRDVGPITKDMLVGRVRQVFWPLSAIRGVE